MGKKNRQSAATLVLGTAVVAAAAIQRQDELSTARTKYISANQSAKAGGGSSFVAKVGREVGNTGKVYGTISDLASNLRTIDPIKAWAKCEDLVKKMKSTIDPDPKTGKAANTPLRMRVRRRYRTERSRPRRAGGDGDSSGSGCVAATLMAWGLRS